jgi:hypothetical protein
MTRRGNSVNGKITARLICQAFFFFGSALVFSHYQEQAEVLAIALAIRAEPSA